MERKLVSMVDATASKIEKVKSVEMTLQEFFESQEREVNLRKQPLEKWMFIPCSESGEMLEKPKNYSPDFEDEFNSVDRDSYVYAWYNDCKTYNKAKSRCLFEGFEYVKVIRNSGGNYTHIAFKGTLEIVFQWGGMFIDNRPVKTIEDLVPYNLTLTENALR